MYTFVIVWFTYDVSILAFNKKFSIIPMFVFPFGVMLRDIKKFEDFQIALKVFRQELPDQEISLAESYSPQIFQMTGLAGFAWMLYTNLMGKSVIFYNDTIQFQIPLLIGVVITKLSILAKNKFKTRRSLFYANMYTYAIYILIVLIIDFKDAFGGSE